MPKDAILTLHFKKRPDGGSALTLERPDGSRTWQRQDRHAAFFVVHDFTHYALESALGLRHAFFGLVADGWDFASFEPPYPNGPLPAEALAAESLVGLLDAERASVAAGATPLTADECRAHLEAAFHGRADRQPLALTDAHLQRIRAHRAALLVEWERTAPGDTLVLRFPGDAP